MRWTKGLLHEETSAHLVEDDEEHLLEAEEHLLEAESETVCTEPTSAFLARLDDLEDPAGLDDPRWCGTFHKSAGGDGGDDDDPEWHPFGVQDSGWRKAVGVQRNGGAKPKQQGDSNLHRRRTLHPVLRATLPSPLTSIIEAVPRSQFCNSAQQATQHATTLLFAKARVHIQPAHAATTHLANNLHCT